MDLQSIFYILAIAIMSLMLGLILTVILFIIKLKSLFDSFRKNPVGKTVSFAANRHEVVSVITMLVSSFIASRFAKKRE